jgi:LL-diaminopimelate aminotransferase
MSTANSTVLPSPSPRLSQMPLYAFAKLDVLKNAARATWQAKGLDLIDLGMGNPDVPVPQPILERISQAVLDPTNQGYPTFWGKQAFRESIARYMQQRFGVTVNPDNEIQPLLGSKEGLAHLTFGYTDESTVALVPSPYYPVHGRASWLAGGNVLELPINPGNGFLPDLDSIPAITLAKAKILFLNYPNNPTAACADLAFYEKAVAFCKQHHIILVSDLAYSEIAFDGYQPPSALQIPGAKDICIEFHSFSKSFSMAGFRIGWACGNPDVVKTLYNVKTNLDYGVCNAIQDGAAFALDNAASLLPDIAHVYQERRNEFVQGFRDLGWPVEPTKATMYLWLQVPSGFTSQAWCEHLINKAGVVVTPGTAFGETGEGFFRITLMNPAPALERLKSCGIRFDAP